MDSDRNALLKSADALRKRYPGVEIVSTTDAMDAVRYSLNHTVDAVYTEVLMPHCSGFDVIRLVRKFYPNARACILSATNRYTDQARKQRIEWYLLKDNVWAEEYGRGKDELEADELERVAAAGGGDGIRCPGCGCTEYEAFSTNEPLSPTAPVHWGGIPFRRCKKCKREFG